MRLITCLLALAVPNVAPTIADAATLKPFSTLTHSVVRLSDIWDGVGNDVALGPAPAPGGRITVSAAQLAAIARQFAVDWRPGTSGDRVILERPGRALTRDDVRPPLWTALLGAGASTDSELDMAAFTAAPVPAEAKLDVTVQQLDLDQVSGRFSALIDVQADDAPVTQLRITGRIQAMVDLPVPRRRLMPGDVVAGGDLEWSRQRVGVARGDVVRVPADAVGLAAKHAIAPGQPIATADLGRPMVVQKGESMILTLESGGLALSARGLAVEPGGVGDRIRVLNDYSKMTVEGEITGPGQARVVPNTARRSDRFVTAR